MTASVAEAVLCAALLLAMALWYGARMGAVPLSRRLAAMAIPLTQACALVAFAVFATRDSGLDRFVPYVVFATAGVPGGRWLCAAESVAGRAQESAQEQARAALSCWKRRVRARPLPGVRRRGRRRASWHGSGAESRDCAVRSG
mgnify:CR=1 FL=1